ncbi:MAG: FeoB small GTPase domain-containing protein [Candidatus Caldatribacteriaceae bacterium]
MKKIVLVGNPNVGKSVIFTQLTGVYAISSNYPGTTVDFLRGTLRKDHEIWELIDAPGTYALSSEIEAERIAGRLVDEADIVVNVVDAGNLERNLYLTFELRERGKPTILALNMWDEAQKRGINIDVEKLEKALGIPVVRIVATSGEGIKELFDVLDKATPPLPISSDHTHRWEEIGKLIDEVQHLSYVKPRFLDWLQKVTIQPVSGFFIALVVLLGSFFLVRGIGEVLIGWLEILFEKYYVALLLKVMPYFSGIPWLEKVVWGEIIEGRIDLEQSMGILSTGVYVPFGVVLPYIVAFYLVLGFLEDIGYLPRVAVLLDGFFHKVGLHGYAIVPSLLGLGCNVPGIMATRILENKTERFIVATLISIGIPCAAQQALIVGALGKYGLKPVLIVYGVLFLVWLSWGMILRYLVPGFRPPLLTEIPPYRLPFPKAIFSKLWVRLRGFLKDALPIVFIGILGVNLLHLTSFFSRVGDLISPFVSHLWGIPKEAVLFLILGFLRKDMAVGMLLPLGLSVKQLIISNVILAMFFPCAAAFVVIFRELGWKRLLEALLIMVSSAMLVGWILNLIL